MADYKKITNIQRYELLEERLGISISGVGAWLEDYGDEFALSLQYEIIAINGGALDHDIEIMATALDENGVGLTKFVEAFYKKKFFGIDSYRSSNTIPAPNIGLIKIFPKMRSSYLDSEHID